MELVDIIRLVVVTAAVGSVTAVPYGLRERRKWKQEKLRGSRGHRT